MTSVSNATAAPIDATAPNGDAIVLHPLSLRDWGWVERTMRQEIVDLARDSVRNSGLSIPEQAVVMRGANDKAGTISIASIKTVQGLLESIPTMLKMVLLALRKGDAKCDEAKVDLLFGSDLTALADTVNTIFEISFPDGKDAEVKKPESDAEGEVPPAEHATTPPST